MKIPQIFLIIFCYLFCACKRNAEDRSFPTLKDDGYTSMLYADKIKYLDSLHNELKSSENNKAARDFHFELATQYYYLNDTKRSSEISKEVLQLANSALDTIDMARANYYIGDTYENSQKDVAYSYYLEAEKLYRARNNQEGIARMLFNKAYILFFEGNYVESEIELAKSLQLLIKLNKIDLLYSSYVLMGANMEKLDEFEDALKYYRLAQGLIPELQKDNTEFDKEYNYKIVIALNIANIYESMRQYSKSIAILEKHLTPEVRQTWPADYAKVLANLAYAKMKSGDTTNVENMFLNALRISEKNRANSDILYKLNNLGEYYLLHHDTAKAQKYLKRALEIGEKIRSGAEIKASLKLLSRADSKNTDRYENRYVFLNDSLAKAQRKNRNKYARIEYETVLLEGQNKRLSENYDSILKIALLLIGTVIFLLVLRYFTNQKRALQAQRQKQLADEEIFDLLKEQQIQIFQTKEEEQNRISRELHDGILNKIYGVRLQLGILNRHDDDTSKVKRVEYINMLQQIEKEIRSLSHDLHVEQLYDQFDFNSLLSNLIQSQNDLQQTKFNLETDPNIDWENVSGLVKITVYRILQEAFLNVIKYAEASNCEVIIKCVKPQNIIVTISDNGKGFEITNDKKVGIGLKNMKSRAKQIGAQLKINSVIEKGTSIELLFKV